MNETPHEPRRPADGGHGVPATPTGSSGPPPTGTDVDDDDYDEAEVQPNRRRFLSGSRLVAIGGVVILAGGGLALALTSGGGGDNGAGGSSSDEPTAEDAAFEFADCMRENGIEDFPDPQVSDDGATLEGVPAPEDLSPEEQEAAEACQGILDEASQLDGEEFSAGELAEEQDRALAHAQCMRDRGWDLPDPEVTDGGDIAMPISPGEDSPIPGPGSPQWDQFEQDQQECFEEAGLHPPGGGVVEGEDGGAPGEGGS
jgi:hypothetical protein